MSASRPPRRTSSAPKTRACSHCARAKDRRHHVLARREATWTAARSRFITNDSRKPTRAHDQPCNPPSPSNRAAPSNGVRQPGSLPPQAYMYSPRSCGIGEGVGGPTAEIGAISTSTSTPKQQTSYTSPWRWPRTSDSTKSPESSAATIRCDALTSAREHPSDALLAALVRIQHIADRAYSILPTPGGTARTYTAPLDMAVAHARRQLDAFAGAQPETVQQDSKKTPALPCPEIQIRKETKPTAHALLSLQDSSPPATACSQRASTSRPWATAAPAPTDPDAARAKLDFATALKGLRDNFALADKWAAENARRRRRRQLREDGGAENTRPDQYASKLGWIRGWYMAKTTGAGGTAAGRGAGPRGHFDAGGTC